MSHSFVQYQKLFMENFQFLIAIARASLYFIFTLIHCIVYFWKKKNCTVNLNPLCRRCVTSRTCSNTIEHTVLELITDRKPLETLFGPRSCPCTRIEQWVLRYNLMCTKWFSNQKNPILQTQPRVSHARMWPH